MDDITLNTENPKETTRKLLVLINDFSTVVEYRINTQKSFVFLYISNGQFAKATKKTIPVIIASTPIKYLGIDLTKEV